MDGISSRVINLIRIAGGLGVVRSLTTEFEELVTTQITNAFGLGCAADTGVSRELVASWLKADGNQSPSEMSDVYSE